MFRTEDSKSHFLSWYIQISFLQFCLVLGCILWEVSPFKNKNKIYIKYKYDCISLTIQWKKEKTPGGAIHWKRVIADINRQQVSIVTIVSKVIFLPFPRIKWRMNLK